MNVVIDDPAEGRLPRIKSLWAFVSIDNDGDEGVCAAMLGDIAVPLIAADEKRLKSLRPLAEEIAARTSKKIVLARFTERVDEEVIDPSARDV